MSSASRLVALDGARISQDADVRAAADLRLRIAGELDHDLRERTCSEGGKPTPRLPVRILHVSPGRFDAGAIADQAGGWLGLLILDGLMVVEIEAGRGHAGWLVGENDLLRPWDMHEISLTSHAEWRVLRSARLALLDDEFARRAGGSRSRSARCSHARA